MATEKETVIIEFQVDQGSAITELEKTKKSIIQIKEEQSDLNKAYKQGNITLEEYASETVRLEGILKKQQATYTNTQKSVTGVKTKMDDLIASNNKLANSVKQSTENIRIAGVSVGDLTTRISSLANPVTAAVGVVTALGAAYARSTIGSKDLEFASNQLSSATTLLTNSFASLISSAEDGEGIVSRFTNDMIQAADDIGTFFSGSRLGFAEASREAAKALEQLEDLQREETRIRGENNERLADNQELMTKIQDSQTDINEKQHLAGEIIDNLRKNESDLLAVKDKQLKIIQDQLDDDKENEKLQQAVLDKTNEISVIKRDTNRRVEAINRLESNLLDTENKKVDALRKQNLEKAKSSAFAQSELEREARIAKLDRELQGEETLGGANPFDTGDFKTQKIGLPDEAIKIFQDQQQKQRDELKKTQLTEQELYEMRLESAGTYFATLATLSSAFAGEQSAFFKATASAETIIGTYQAATKALNSPPGPPVSFAYAALTIATGLANLARINEVSFAAGGGDFVTKGPALLMVGDNPGGVERVTVEPISGKGKTTVNGNMYAMAGGGTLTAGQLTASDSTSKFNQALTMANLLKMMPTPVVSWREWSDINDRVTVKEDVSSF